ncbi:hypothetical protein [Nonomuraea salmonea]|uniref:hypothetical protein n=1 Tax=Nonomuraea salmonea TaxID=46181 RepID=UPI002FEAACDB
MEAEPAEEAAWQALEAPTTFAWLAAHQAYVRRANTLVKAATEWERSSTHYGELLSDYRLGDAHDQYVAACVASGVRPLLSVDRGRSVYGCGSETEDKVAQRKCEAQETLKAASGGCR